MTQFEPERVVLCTQEMTLAQAAFLANTLKELESAKIAKAEIVDTEVLGYWTNGREIFGAEELTTEFRRFDSVKMEVQSGDQRFAVIPHRNAGLIFTVEISEHPDRMLKTK